jgi:hypothetical protein
VSDELDRNEVLERTCQFPDDGISLAVIHMDVHFAQMDTLLKDLEKKPALINIIT